jgi:hypothetical protein
VYPNTNVIVSENARKEYYDRVVKRMEARGIREANAIQEFCTLAGIPD